MQSKAMNFKKHQGGFSLMDIMLWAGIVLAGFFALMAINSMAKGKLNSTNEARDLPTIIAGIQNTYSSQSTYVGATMDTVARGNVWPATQTTIPGAGAATVMNRWSGNVTLAPATITTANDIARLVYPNVPATECISVVNAAAGSLRRVYVDSANSGTAGAGTMVKADGAVLNVTTLATACSGTQNSITYDIPKA